MVRVTGHDNRGDLGAPYGFVYFSDHTRCGYTPGHEEEVWAVKTDGGWNLATSMHIGLATSYLRQRGLLAKPTSAV